MEQSNIILKKLDEDVIKFGNEETEKTQRQRHPYSKHEETQF